MTIKENNLISLKSHEYDNNNCQLTIRLSDNTIIVAKGDTDEVGNPLITIHTHEYDDDFWYNFAITKFNKKTLNIHAYYSDDGTEGFVISDNKVSFYFSCDSNTENYEHLTVFINNKIVLEKFDVF